MSGDTLYRYRWAMDPATMTDAMCSSTGQRMTITDDGPVNDFRSTTKRWHQVHLGVGSYWLVRWRNGGLERVELIDVQRAGGSLLNSHVEIGVGSRVLDYVLSQCAQFAPVPEMLALLLQANNRPRSRDTDAWDGDGDW